MSEDPLAAQALKAVVACVLLLFAALARATTAAQLAGAPARTADFPGPAETGRRAAVLMGELVWAAFIAPSLILIIQAASGLVPQAGLTGAVAVSAYAGLVLGTALPARIGERHAGAFARRGEPILRAISLPLRPFVSHLLRRRAAVTRAEPAAEEEEKLLTRLIDASGDGGAEEEPETLLVRKLLGRVLHLRETPVSAIMRQRAEIVWIGQREPAAAAARVMRESKHSRVPVCGRDLDDVVGILHLKDVFLARHGAGSGATVGAISRQPSFVDQELALSALLARWRRGAGTLSVVRDRGGRVVGIVTLSDVLDWLLQGIEAEGRPPNTRTTNTVT
jgi:putative hemolysin